MTAYFRYLFVSIMLISSILSYSTDFRKIDSLKRELIKQNDTTRIKILIQLSEQYFNLKNKNNDSALFFINLAMDMIGNQTNALTKSKIFNQIGTIYHENGNFNIALDYFFKDLSLLEKLSVDSIDNPQIQSEISFVCNNVGNCFFRLENIIRLWTKNIEKLFLVH